MKYLPSSRRLIRMWHKREKATLDHLVGSVGGAKAENGRTHSPFTSTGLVVEEQVRKAWRPQPIGLAMF